MDKNEFIKKRMKEKGHSDPERGLQMFGKKTEQFGEPRFSMEGFVWNGAMITDPTKDETGRFDLLCCRT